MKKMERRSPEEKKITRELALFVGGTNVSYSTVENELFRRYSCALNSRYTVPSRRTIMKTFANVCKEVNQSIRENISLAPYVTAVLDLWTKSDQTPFLGLCLFYFDETEKRTRHILLALRQLPHPHTGDRIFDTVMSIFDEWSIPRSKLLKIVTDNGSNVLKAFKNLSAAVDYTGENIEIESDAESSSDEDGSGSDDEIDHLLDNYDHQLRCNLNLEDEESDNAETAAAEAESLEIHALNEESLENDISSFDKLDGQLQKEWHKVHFSCTVHTLQLVVKSFEKAPAVNGLLKSALKLVAQITKSSKRSTNLKDLTGGYNLLKHCPTRWSSMYRLLERLLHLQEHVIQVRMKLYVFIWISHRLAFV